MSIGGIDDTIDRTDKHMDDRPTGRPEEEDERSMWENYELESKFFYQLTRVDVSEAHAEVRIEAV